MRRSFALPEFNYWPGFVDVMFNVVLSVLLITGLMVVGMLSLNMEAVRSGRAVQQVGQIQRIQKAQESVEEKQLLAVLGGLLNAQSKAGGLKSDVTNPGPAPPAENRSRPAEITWRIESHAVRGINEDWNVLQQLIDGKSVGLFEGSGVDANGGLAGAKGGDNGKASLSSSGANGANGANGLGHKPFFLQFAPLQFRLKAQQSDDLKRFMASAPDASTWLLLSSAPAEDKSQLEAALWRLTSVKQNILNGTAAKGSEIQIRLVPLKDQLSDGSRVFVLPLFAHQP
jgi:hypothetical protein